MADLAIYRALAGGAGLAACIALLVDQARTDETEFADATPVVISARPAAAADIAPDAPRKR
jgi:hypothetical protein